MEKIAQTAKLNPIGNIESFSNTPLMPSIAYVSGSRYEKNLIKTGRFPMGVIAPDRKNKGKMTKFIIIWKPSASLILQAKDNPSDRNISAIRTMKETIPANRKMNM